MQLLFKNINNIEGSQKAQNLMKDKENKQVNVLI